MGSYGVLVHYPSRLPAAVAVLAAELQCGDGVFANETLKHAKTVHLFDCVMSHIFKSSRLSRYDSELKLPSPPSGRDQTRRHLTAVARMSILGSVLAT